MNKYNVFLKMRYLALLLVTFVAGCASNGGETNGLISIAVTPASVSMPVSGIQQYSAVATYADGSSRDVTSASSWVSATPANATVSSPAGLATGVAGGTSLITANFGGKTSSATVTVTDSTLQSVTVTPLTAFVPIGGNHAFSAVATYSDGSSIPVTTSASWLSSAPGLATVLPATGLATGVASGTALITANFGGKSGSATLNVSTTTLLSIAIAPAAPTLQIGAARQMMVLGTYSDGITLDVTTSTRFVSATAANASITDSAVVGASNGLTTGLAAGTSLITASFGGKTATTTVTVSPTTLSFITVTPTNASVAITGSTPFIAMGHYSDGTSAIISNTGLTWSSNDITIATILANGVGNLSTGVATGAKAGSVTIKAASTLDLTKSGSATLIVTAAKTLQSITVAPINATVAINGTASFVATGHYSDNTSAVMPNSEVTWNSNDITVATVIANGVGNLSTGAATGNKAGTATIKATSTLDNTKSGSATLIVTAAGSAPLAINLGKASTFGIAAGAGMTSTGITIVTGDVALTPTGTCTDAALNCAVETYANAAGLTVNGKIRYAADPFDNGVTATAVKSDLNAAWLAGRAMVATLTVAGGQLDSVNHYAPGIYSNANLNMAVGGRAILDAGGDPDKSFIFLVGTTLSDSGIVANPSAIILTGGAQAKNVWFIVGLDATIGDGSIWNGNVLAGNDLTVNSFARMNGRALSGANVGGAGAISLKNGATISVP